MNEPIPAPTTEPTPITEPSGPTGEPKPAGAFSQEDLNRFLAEERRKFQSSDEHKAGQAALKRIKELEDAQKSESERLTERAAGAEATVAELKAELAARDHADLRRKVASKHKLPEALASRLSGATEDELDADAKELAKLVRTEDTERPRPAPGNTAGPRPNGSAGPGTDLEFAKREMQTLRAPMGRL